MKTRRIAGRLPAGLLGMVAGVAILDGTVFRSDPFNADHAESWRFKGDWARGPQAARAEILVFGDSLMEFGVLPPVVANRLGRTTLNMAVHDGSPATSLTLLRRALAAGARPRAILVDFLPHQLARSLRDGGAPRAWPGLATPGEAATLAVMARDPEFFAATMTARLLGCLAAREEIRSAILPALRGEAVLPRQDVALLRRHWQANDGAQVIPDRVNRPRGPVDGLFPPTWQLDPTADASVRAFLDLTEARQIPVFWVVPPLRPDAQEWRDRMGLDAPYFSYIAARIADTRNVTVVEARNGGFAAEWFADAVHLKRSGAEMFSRALAEMLAGSPAPGSTVLLTAPDAAAPDHRVEDLDQTRTANGNARSPIPVARPPKPIVRR